MLLRPTSDHICLNSHSWQCFTSKLYFRQSDRRKRLQADKRFPIVDQICMHYARKWELNAAHSGSTTPICLTIAGSDSGGGAGIQADLKTFAALGVFGTSAITALTAQNTQGVHSIHEVPVESIRGQIISVVDDMHVQVVKIGMLPSVQIVRAVAECLRARPWLKVVLDPVLISTSGHNLAASDVSQAIREELFPLATVLTPNLSEAAALLGGGAVESLPDMEEAARKLHSLGPQAVLVKGGHLNEPAASESKEGSSKLTDVFYDGRSIEFIAGPRIETQNTHGTGCTTASAIAAHLARGDQPLLAVHKARQYVTGALAASRHLQIGAGPQRPFNHMHSIDDWSEKTRNLDLRLYAVTDPACNLKWKRSNAEAVDLAIQGGATFIQLREKSADGSQFCREAAAVLAITRKAKVQLVINDRIDVALAVGADGVHVGQDDIPASQARQLLGPNRILGVSVKTVEQAQKAERDSADYLGAGAMFQTSTKDSSTITFETLGAICKSVSIPVVAIGGIKSQHVAACLNAGCQGVAVVSAIFGSPDPSEAARGLCKELQK